MHHIGPSHWVHRSHWLPMIVGTHTSHLAMHHNGTHITLVTNGGGTHTSHSAMHHIGVMDYIGVMHHIEPHITLGPCVILVPIMVGTHKTQRIMYDIGPWITLGHHW